MQYHESDLAFASRLTEHLGISFYFSQGDEGETIVFTDHAAGFTPIEDAASAPYRPRGEGLDVFALEAKHAMVPGYYAVRDYNYRTPLVDITGEASIEDAFPGGVDVSSARHHKTPQEGAALARKRARRGAPRGAARVRRREPRAAHRGRALHDRGSCRPRHARASS